MKYTRKKIQNAINYWQNVLDEHSSDIIEESNNEMTDFYFYVTKLNSCFNSAVRKVGISRLKDFNVKSRYMSTCVPKRWELHSKVTFDSPPPDKKTAIEYERYILNKLGHRCSKEGGTELICIGDKDIDADVDKCIEDFNGNYKGKVEATHIKLNSQQKET